MPDTANTDSFLTPILPLRDIVVFPHMVVPLFVGRDQSIKALEEVMRDEKRIVLLTQKDPDTDDPKGEDVYDRGCIAKILQLLKLPDGTVRVLVEGEERIVVEAFTDNDAFMECYVSIEDDVLTDKKILKALAGNVTEAFSGFAKLNKKVAEEVTTSVSEIKSPSKLSDIVAVHLNAPLEEKQTLLSEVKVEKRLEKILRLIEGEMSILSVEKRIRGRVKRQMEKTQREYYLNEQMKAIQSEMGNDGPDEMEELAKAISETKFTKEAKEKAEAELKRLKSMSPMSAEANVSRNYLDWMLSVPWNKRKRLRKNLTEAQKVLDDDHYGLDKVKDRILEHLAVQTRTKKLKGPILCLVGPPGVGKTSLGKSIARATNREFVRVSLGGVRDESEIRGHRRTYIGSMPTAWKLFVFRAIQKTRK